MCCRVVKLIALILGISPYTYVSGTLANQHCKHISGQKTVTDHRRSKVTKIKIKSSYTCSSKTGGNESQCSLASECRPSVYVWTCAFACVSVVICIFLCCCLRVCKTAHTAWTQVQQVCACVRETGFVGVPSPWLCTSHEFWMSSFCIISFKPPSHTIIQFSLLDNDHVILIWQVDYTASHTRLLMLRKRLRLLYVPSRLDGLL